MSDKDQLVQDIAAFLSSRPTVTITNVLLTEVDGEPVAEGTTGTAQFNLSIDSLFKGFIELRHGHTDANAIVVQQSVEERGNGTQESDRID